MSFKSSIWAGHFHPEIWKPGKSIPEECFADIFNRFADRDSAGNLLSPLRRPGWEQSQPKRLMGYIANEYVIFHLIGFVEAIFLATDPRTIRFLAACHRELGCELIDANSGENVTCHFAALAGRLNDSETVTSR